MERARFFDGDQWRLLKQRSIEALLGDRAFLGRYLVFWLLLVAFVYFWMASIGISCCLVPEHAESHFAVENKVFSSLAVTGLMGAFWMGAMAGAGVLVRERTMFVRECGAANLNIAAYLGSKVHSLSLLGIVAVMAYLPVARGTKSGVEQYMGAVPVGWFLIALLATMVCGVCFGLMVSALSRRVWQSQLAVGVLAIGMGLFSLNAASFTSQAGIISQWFTPLSWARASMVGYGSTPSDELSATIHLLPVMCFALVFLAIAYVFLKRQGYGESRE